MFYDIGTVSNRNIQLLYRYRILREPSTELTAICRDSEPMSVTELSWSLSDRELDGYNQVYETVLVPNLSQQQGIPFLEFQTEEELDWKWIADFIGVELMDSRLILYSTTNYLTNLPINIYCCYGLRHISSMLEDILEKLRELMGEYDQLENSIKKFKDTGKYLTRPEGLIPNLIKIENSDLVDSSYKIMIAESNRLFVNYSQDVLNQMEHIFNEKVEFRLLNKEHYTLDNFVAPVLQVSGNGDLVLMNLKGQVIVTDWEGTITIVDCPDVHLTAKDDKSVCKLTKLQINKNSVVYLENYVHFIKELTMLGTSLCRHWRANVRNLSYIGPGCVYWCCAQVSVPGRVQLRTYDVNTNTVYDFNMHDVIGTFLSDFDNMMIVGQKNLTPRLGNSDYEPAPGMYVPHWKAEYNVTSGG